MPSRPVSGVVSDCGGTSKLPGSQSSKSSVILECIFILGHPLKNVCFELLPGSIQTQEGGSGNFCLFFKLEGQLIKDWLKIKI